MFASGSGNSIHVVCTDRKHMQILLILIFSSLGVLVGFVVHEYSVEENINTIDVCLNLSVPIAVMIEVTLSVRDGTARCKL